MFKCSLASCLIVVALANYALAIPADELLKSLRPSADVNDFAGVLTPAEREQLESRCRQLRERTGAQLAVVTIKSLDGGEIDDFTNKLFKRWGIGQKDKKNGVLLLVAMADRKARIEVGYGLEPIIPDALAGRIIDQQLKPQFRNQHYAAGLQAAVNSICERIESGKPADRQALAREKQPADTFSVILMFAIFVAVGGIILGAGVGLPRFGVIMFGLVVGGGFILAGLAAAGIVALALHIPAAILGTSVGWRMTKNGFSGPRPIGRRHWNVHPSPWTWGNFGGYSGGGWSSGGGGFSQGWGGFGGGSSGGGGASGGW